MTSFEPNSGFKREIREKAGEKVGNQIFVGRLPLSATENDLREYFAYYGEIRSANVKRTGEGKSRGFAFVSFANRDAIDAAMADKDQHWIQDTHIGIDFDNILAFILF